MTPDAPVPTAPARGNSMTMILVAGLIAFIAGLAYAEATQFVDEGAQRQVMLDAYNRVLLEGIDPAESIRIAAAEDQALLDQFTGQ